MCVYVYLCRTEATYYLYVRDDRSLWWWQRIHFTDLTLGLLYRSSRSSSMMMMFGGGSSTSTDDDGWSWTLGWCMDRWMDDGEYEEFALRSCTELDRGSPCVCVWVWEGEPRLTYTSWYLVLTHVYITLHAHYGGLLDAVVRCGVCCCCCCWLCIYMAGWLALTLAPILSPPPFRTRQTPWHTSQ